MKLVYATGACSFSIHVLMEELGIPYEAIRVSLEDKKVLESYNPRSYVPVLQLDDNEILTEAISILLFLSEQNEDAFMPIGHMARAKCIEWLSFISSEMHKGVGPLFHREGLKTEYLKEVMRRIDMRFTTLDEQLNLRKYIMGEDYTIADMYCLAILRIAEHLKIQIENYPNVARYKELLEARPAVKKADRMEAEAKVETQIRSFIRRNQEGERVQQQLY